MPSRALSFWNTTSAARLDQVAAAHAALGATKPGRRFATDQINHAYLVLLAAAFQRFCRDLHTESTAALLGSLGVRQPVENVLLANALHGRQLDTKNATTSTIGGDFGRLGLRVLDDLVGLRASNAERIVSLDRMNSWRNAIAHQDFGRRALVPPTLQLKTVATWRRQCGSLADDLDRVMAAHLTRLVGAPPW